MLYLPYYSLKEKPFQDTADPKFLWLGEGQSEAIAILNFGIDKGEGITVLTGDIGAGKTVLANYLADLFKDKFQVAKINDSDLESLDFLYFLADSLKLPDKFEDKKAFFAYIDEEYSKTKKAMLIIMDEAHRSTKSLLNDLNLMTKIKRNEEQLINIVLVGQNSLIELIKEQPLNDTKQKAPILCYLRPFTENETNEYIKYRLRISGTKIPLFSSGAIGKIFRYSGGIPRVINNICDHALMIGYSTDLKKINTSAIKDCAEDLQIENKVLENGKDIIKRTSEIEKIQQSYRKMKQKLLNWTS
jgi:general secretion pathway protein A